MSHLPLWLDGKAVFLQEDPDPTGCFMGSGEQPNTALPIGLCCGIERINLEQRSRQVEQASLSILTTILDRHVSEVRTWVTKRGRQHEAVDAIGRSVDGDEHGNGGELQRQAGIDHDEAMV